MGRCDKITTPTSLVLLGATGDLARKKLLPALYDLSAAQMLPERFHVVGFSKDDLSTEEYRAFVRTHATERARTKDHGHLEHFVEHFTYVQGSFDDRAAFMRIKEALEFEDAHIGMCASKLFYLAVPPSFYDTIFEQIAHTKLDRPCTVGEGWVRILVEKPFGSDLDHARKLEDKLSVLFKEEQIYRIDHYLAKDALQNILAFRFSNVLFEDQWNKDFVEAVYMRVYEQFDVSTRGAFFDGVGALRDVGQNHMLQMLALIAMERPEVLSADALRTRRAEVLRTLRIPTTEDIDTTIIKGQYAGYLDTKNVASDSKTETYFALKAHLDDPRWEGVPFYLEHGKAMHTSMSDITIRFRSATNCVCGETQAHEHPNFVRFSISPEQKITLRFWVRKPGLKYELTPEDLVFDRHKALSMRNGAVVTDAYEEVLFDAICGDQTLFVSSAEQSAAWEYVTAILRLWQDHTPAVYDRESNGPSSKLMREAHERMTLSS
jgi:glucose-6-phosphate 1-dehydrogenase